MAGAFAYFPTTQNTIWTYITGSKPSTSTLALCFLTGFIILILCIECTISIESNSKRKPTLLILRTFLATLAIIIYLDAVVAPHELGGGHLECAVATIGSYGIFKTWEICFAPLLDGALLPNWVPRRELKEKAAMVASNGVSNGVPNGTVEKAVEKENSRIYYSFDFLSTLRGVSWYLDRRFDFLAPVYIQAQNRTPPRGQFIKDRLIHLLLVELAYDVFDTINKSQKWMRITDITPLSGVEGTTLTISNVSFAHQVTIQPIYKQAAFVLSTAVTTQLSLEVFYTLLALLCVGVFNISTSAFPHFYSSPFSLRTNSVQSFWGERWHHIFRRVFDRIIDPWIHVLGISKRSVLGKWLRVTAVFSLSAILHCVIQARVQVYHCPPGVKPPLWDVGTLSFFLSQPIALGFEYMVLQPVLRQLPPSVSWTVSRVWTWGWLFWTARWWTDGWVRMGMWQPEEQVVFLSPVRGLWRGEWIVQPY